MDEFMLFLVHWVDREIRNNNNDNDDVMGQAKHNRKKELRTQNMASQPQG